MAEPVTFYFDARCPWAFQTSRWMRRLEELGVVNVHWAVFSLNVVHAGDEGRATDRSKGAAALRTTIALRGSHGDRAVGHFYEALGSAIHIHRRDADAPEVIIDALHAAGADRSVYERAMGDASTWEAVLAEHDSVVQQRQAFGVPTIVLDGGTGLAMFGPVICELPNDADAVALWEHTSWLVRHDGFAELKRDRPRQPSFATLDHEGDGARAA